ncbi:MAG: hypothetical protein CVV28_05280 [Methanobacteriales archaeon HGW-Methanobacteriales-1]|jgi:beta-lactamase superfamily II metal-dependent hydrolase|nr:MAG: hypothetical protein CVV28_05280 [Methanobacteriales archaeon HGW-Methanobacteriales-1]
MLKLHFLNVGDGDCCIVELPGHTTVVDINKSKSIGPKASKEIIGAIKSKYPDKNLGKIDSEDPKALENAGYTIQPQDPIEYIKENKISSIFRFISTHPHMDHLRHFAELTETVDISNLWIIDNKFGPDKKLDKKSRKSDWSTYTQFRDSDSISIEEEASAKFNVVRPMEKAADNFYKPDNIKILSPNIDLVKTAEDDGNQNVMSYVLLIEYGPHKIVLGGDAEQENWKYILENYADLIKDVTILKASHHGRETGFYEPAVEQMKPKYTIQSVGNTMKPKDDAVKKYKELSKNVITTRWKGNVVIECHEDGRIECTPQFK